MLLCNFWKAFETLVIAHLMRQLETLGARIDMQWGSHALYESVSGKVHTAIELSEVVTNITEVKHGCPLSPLSSVSMLMRYHIT